MQELVVPTLGESITEAIVGKWLVRVGEHVGEYEPVLDLETDKITVQVMASCTGALTAQNYAEGDTVKVGEIVGLIDESSQADARGSKESENRTASPSPETLQKEKQKTSQKEDGLSPIETKADGTVEPSLPVPERDQAGRVISPARRRAIREGKAAIVPVPQGQVPSPRGRQEPRAAENIVAMSPLRRRIAERLVTAQQSTASLTTFNEVDMSAIIEMRALYKEEFLKKHEVKLGFMSFAVKASVEALKLFPGVNAEVRGTDVVYKNVYDLGIAVGTEKGLVVPVIRDCDAMSFADVEQGIVEMAQKARTNKLVLDDLLGGTFTITNGGIYGSLMSTPLLNFPQTGILGLHNIVKRPVAVENDAIAVRPMMNLALTYDHRVVDGREAVQFLVAVKDRMENPQRLLFEI